jgi:xylose isomerase
MKYATRLNSFAARPELYWKNGSSKPTTLDLIERASQVEGLDAIDLNFPDHFAKFEPREILSYAQDHNLMVNGFAMRYYSEPEFKLGAFTHPDPHVRRKALDLTKRAVDLLGETGGDLLTIWLGQDGWDYPFQVDYRAVWDWEVEGIREVAEHNPRISISIEYKPSEPRAFSLLGDLGTTLLAIKAVDRSNLGVTLDFAHVLYAGELPAFVAALAQHQSQLLGIHLNDGYGRRDDGLMVGTVSLTQTLELLYQVVRTGFDGIIYFDTFPDTIGLDPALECQNNIAMVNCLRKVAQCLVDQTDLLKAIERQDAVASQAIVRQALFEPFAGTSPASVKGAYRLSFEPPTNP